MYLLPVVTAFPAGCIMQNNTTAFFYAFVNEKEISARGLTRRQEGYDAVPTVLLAAAASGSIRYEYYIALPNPETASIYVSYL